MSTPRYTRELLTRTAAVSTSAVDMLRRLETPLGAVPLRYLLARLDHHAIDVSHFADEPLPTRERRTYTREQLAEAARHARSVREVIEYLGHPPRDSPYGHVRKKLDEFGIDTRHFTRGRRHGPEILPREPLTSAAASSDSVAGLLRSLGMADNAAARARLRRSAAAHGVSFSHFTAGARARGSVAPRRKTAAEILRRQEPGAARTATRLLRRALDEEGVPHECAECGIGDVWRGRRLVLQVDHVNGDRLDDRLGNLRYLCPSCHSQTPTYAGRPRGGAVGRSPVQ
ncbi:HNH endonuclease signature motif containing protein [Actinacidiphila rubida]|uniref:HNH endonuclease n=1 Tax=Actinacidiphila rubida TaxID=310780 RepID=A0A1H8HXU2_9ACTN|nr:HNH endonuclease [Actinacidiphila rubida]SEN60834.1 hypothetical protein SAMN05216267_1007100 [Actinacidiphila rubida]